MSLGCLARGVMPDGLAERFEYCVCDIIQPVGVSLHAQKIDEAGDL
jgi:hypothetical protein